MRYRVGIYGGMGCGKSTVSACLRALGAYVLDADKINADLAADEAYLSAVAELCPAAIRADVFDKRALRHWVLASEDNRQALMAVAHPMIADRIEAETHDGLSFVELSVYVPDLIAMDESWHVVCSPETQLARVLARGGWSEGEAIAMIKRQQEDGLAPADAIILVNDGDREALCATVTERYRALIKRLG